MSKWRVGLENVGRGKVCRSVEFAAISLPAAEQRALRECSKHLMSRDIYLGDKCDLTYIVLAGCCPVGKVLITSI